MSACAPCFERTAIRKTKNSRRICRTHFHHALEIDQPLVNEVKSQPDRGFQTGDAKRRLVKLQRFFVLMMWRVIGRNRVDRAVLHRCQNRVDVIAAAQRRTHLRVRVVLRDGFVSQRPVMRRHFATHRQTFILCAVAQLRARRVWKRERCELWRRSISRARNREQRQRPRPPRAFRANRESATNVLRASRRPRSTTASWQ